MKIRGNVNQGLKKCQNDPPTGFFLCFTLKIIVENIVLILDY